MIAEINVTPMVDVMLVLLIIFIVSAPLLTVGVPLDLPQTQARAWIRDKTRSTLSVNLEGEVFLNDTEYRDQRSAPTLKAITEARGGSRSDLRPGRQEGRLRHRDEGDRTAFGRRFKRVALVTEDDQG